MDTSDIREWLYTQSDDAVVDEIQRLRGLLRTAYYTLDKMKHTIYPDEYAFWSLLDKLQEFKESDVHLFKGF